MVDRVMTREEDAKLIAVCIKTPGGKMIRIEDLDPRTTTIQSLKQQLQERCFLSSTRNSHHLDGWRLRHPGLGDLSDCVTLHAYFRDRAVEPRAPCTIDILSQSGQVVAKRGGGGGGGEIDTVRLAKGTHFQVVVQSGFHVRSLLELEVAGAPVASFVLAPRETIHSEPCLFSGKAATIRATFTPHRAQLGSSRCAGFYREAAQSKYRVRTRVWSLHDEDILEIVPLLRHKEEEARNEEKGGVGKLEGPGNGVEEEEESEWWEAGKHRETVRLVSR